MKMTAYKINSVVWRNIAIIRLKVSVSYTFYVKEVQLC
jgi:hypothetical protein